MFFSRQGGRELGLCFMVRCSSALSGPGAFGSAGLGSRALCLASGCLGLSVLGRGGPMAMWCP